MKKILLSWSSGKDSAWALQLLRSQADVEVVGVLTAFNGAHDRVAMHAVRRMLVQEQSERVRLSLWPVELPWPCSNAQYEELMSAVCSRAVDEGVEAIAFGDLFLEEIRAYRERQHDRVAMHAVRRMLVQEQSERVRLSLWPVELPWPCSNAQYEELMSAVCSRAVDEGVEAIAFGDLFLEEIRAYRERQLQGTGLKALFPLWELQTDKLAREMLGAGLKAKLTCVDRSKLNRSFAGREFDAALLEDFPEGVDPCGENGEFHTFVYDGPMFERPIDIEVGEIVERDGFVFADLTPTEHQ